jgi:hypothetical protein
MSRAYECSRCHHVQDVGVIDNGRGGFADPHTRCKGCRRKGTFHFAPGWEREQSALIAEIVAVYARTTESAP